MGTTVHGQCSTLTNRPAEVCTRCICLHIFAPAGSAGGAPLPTAYRLAAHLLIYAASSPTQTSLTNSQKSWSGFKQHFAAITSRKRLLRSLPGNAHCLVLLDSCV